MFFTHVETNLADIVVVMKDFSCALRKLDKNDEAILYELLYQAIFVPEGRVPPAREVVHLPELSKYVKDFGRPGDLGLAAFDKQKLMGAVWLRQLKGYGYVNDETPELTMAVVPEYRGQGIGTFLLEHLFEHAKETYNSISLSVWRVNPALRLYQRFGFEIVKELQDEVVMLKKL